MTLKNLTRLEATATKYLGVDVSLNERLFVRCSKRLEPLLRRELSALGLTNTTTEWSGRHGVVEVVTTPNTHQRICLMSRLADRVLLCLGEPVRQNKSLSSLYHYAMSLPWSNYIHLGAGMSTPKVKVSVDGSQFSVNSNEIARRVASALLIHQKAHMEKHGDTIDTSLEEVMEKSEKPHLSPTIHVNIFHDTCQIAIDCSGLLGLRSWKSEEDKERILQFAASRMSCKPKQTHLYLPGCSSSRLLDSQAAAIVLKSPFLRKLSNISPNDTLILWDPFCGSGTLILEVLGIIYGLTPARITSKFPFMNFPCHNWPDYKTLRSDICLIPHPSWQKLKVFASDGFIPTNESKNISLFQSNFQQFLSLFDRHSIQHYNSHELKQFVKQQLMLSPGILPKSQSVLKILTSNCFILTAIPFKSENHRATVKLHRIYKDFGKLISSRSDWNGVFVAAAADSRFKEISGLNWISHLRFESGECLGGGPSIELLEWAPSTNS